MNQDEITGMKSDFVGQPQREIVIGVAGMNKVSLYYKALYRLMEAAAAGELSEITVKLVPEPTNQYDAKAIKVFVNENQVGYVSKQDQHLLNAHCPVIYEKETVAKIESWGVFKEEQLYCFLLIDTLEVNKFNLDAAISNLK